MKKIAIIAALFALSFTACRDDVEILRKLTKEEASVIPFTKGQAISYVDHNNKVVTLTVEYDEQEKMNYHNPNSNFEMFQRNSKTHWEGESNDCYGRVVKMYDNVYDNASMVLFALPDSLVGVYMERDVVDAEPRKMRANAIIDLKKSHVDSISIGEKTYYDVYTTRDPRVVYSCTEGMLLLKTSDCMYEKLP